MVVTNDAILFLMQKKTNNTQVATKSDIQSLEKNIYELRTASKRTEKSLRGGMLKVEVRVENIEESQKRVETKLDKIDNTLDGFVGRVDNLAIDNEVGANQIHEIRKNIKNHENRITQLETASQSSQ